MQVNRIQDVVKITQKSEDSILDEVKKDLQIIKEKREKDDLVNLKARLEAEREIINKKLEWVNGMLGKSPKIKTTRAPHGTTKLLEEGLERYFKSYKGQHIQSLDLRPISKEILGGFQPSDALIWSTLKMLRKRFNITAHGAPQLRTYMLENT